VLFYGEKVVYVGNVLYEIEKSTTGLFPADLALEDERFAFFILPHIMAVIKEGLVFGLRIFPEEAFLPFKEEIAIELANLFDAGDEDFLAKGSLQ
jgi:hypothetical protein